MLIDGQPLFENPWITRRIALIREAADTVDKDGPVEALLGGGPYRSDEVRLLTIPVTLVPLVLADLAVRARHPDPDHIGIVRANDRIVSALYGVGEGPVPSRGRWQGLPSGAGTSISTGGHGALPYAN